MHYIGVLQGARLMGLKKREQVIYNNEGHLKTYLVMWQGIVQRRAKGGKLH